MLFLQNEIGKNIVNFATDSIVRGKMTLHDGVEELKTFSLNDFIADFSQRFVHFTINLAIAIVVFYIGKFIINRIYNVVGAVMVRRRVDTSLTLFVLSFIKIVLYFILIVTVIGILGIETSSFLALFASAGVAIGMALSGTLQNFAGGVLIMLLKPYRIGDYIEAQGYAGTVREIQIFHTLIYTPDNKAILIPNGGLSTSSINNWSREKVRRVAWTVSISYGDDVSAARSAILEMFADDDRVLKCDPSDPTSCEEAEEQFEEDHNQPGQPQRPGFWQRIFHHKNRVATVARKIEERQEAQLQTLRPVVVKPPEVKVGELASSSVDLTVRVWVRSADYWAVFYDYNERFYNELPSKGINFPFPQMDVHVKES